MTGMTTTLALLPGCAPTVAAPSWALNQDLVRTARAATSECPPELKSGEKVKKK